MTLQSNFAGYPGQVWSTGYQALAWLNGLLATGGSASSVAEPVNLVFQTLRNGATAIEAWQNGAALSLETQNLAEVEALPLLLDPTTEAYLNARVLSVSIAADGISAIPPAAVPFTAATLLANGSPAIPYSGYLEWCMAFRGETPPVGATVPFVGAYAQFTSAQWYIIANTIGVLQGTNPTSAYDTAARMFRCSTVTAVMLTQLPTIAFESTDLSLVWNATVALPTILLDGASLSTSPAILQAQQANVIRYVLNQTAAKLAIFLYSLRTAVGAAPITAVLSNNDTLLDLASRQTGNFENWIAIAAANNLTPPYPGPTNQAVAQSGQQLYLPGSGVQVGVTGTPPSYPNSAMGTDYYFGPINGAQPPWNGDIPLITGLLNFAGALGRRLQTPIGSLTYHSEYGSRIPGEVGAVQSADEASRLAAFGKAAMAADKRTGRILSAIASVRPGFLATFAGVVAPIGPGADPVRIVESITPPGA